MSVVSKTHTSRLGHGNRRRIGVFGGTFDPIHVGHLAVASAAAHDVTLDLVLFLVAHKPWQKVDKRQVAPSRVRFEMVKAATAGRDDFEASALEIDRGGLSYTIDTVEHLRLNDPESDFVLVVGSDVVEKLDTWHRHEELRELCEVAVVDRPGSAGAVAPAGWVVSRVEAPLLDLSSTVLRQRMVEAKPVDFLVPAEALQRWKDLTGSDDLGE